MWLPPYTPLMVTPYHDAVSSFCCSPTWADVAKIHGGNRRQRALKTKNYKYQHIVIVINIGSSGLGDRSLMTLGHCQGEPINRYTRSPAAAAAAARAKR